MLGNINTPSSPIEHTSYGTTGWGSWGSATAPEAKHTSWKKSLSCLALESLWWPEHCKSDQAGHAFSLPLDCCDCLDWNQISTEKTYHKPHQAFKSQACQKLLFLNHFLCLAFVTHSLHSHILLCSQESLNTVHLISSDTIQYRAVSKTIAYGVYLVPTFISVVVVVMSGFDLCWSQLILFLCIW